jgi:intraflagellar transport protein 74
MAMRPPSGAGRPASGMMPPQTGAIRGASSYGQQAGAGLALGAAPQVIARPTVESGVRASATRAGLTTAVAPTTSRGSGRMVADRSYYIGQLRPKIMELESEIANLRNEEQQIQNNSGTIVQLQQKHKTLQEEVGRLKSRLYDANFAIERAATSDVDGMNGEAQMLRLKNAEERKNVDRVWTASKEADTTAKRLQAELDDELSRLDQRLATADASIHAQYRASRERAYRAADKVAALQQEMRNLVGRQESLMAMINQDPDKKKAAAMTLDVLRKRQQREEMNKTCSITVEEEKQMLAAEAKAATGEIEALNRRLITTKDEILDLRRKVASAEEDVQEYSGDNLKKFQELQDKDKEMTEFMESFPAKEAEELENIKKLEAGITAALDLISKRQLVKESMPTGGALLVEQLAGETKEKEKQVAAARATHERLQKQLEEKKEELDKVQVLDGKIASELEALNRRIEEQKGEIVKFADLDALRREVESRKKQLQRSHASLTKQRDAAKQQLHTLSKTVDGAKQALNEDDVYKSLVEQEQRLRMVYQSFFALDDFVRSKEKESNYAANKAECLRLVDDCNALLKEGLKRPVGVEFVGNAAQGQQRQQDGNVLRLF